MVLSIDWPYSGLYSHRKFYENEWTYAIQIFHDLKLAIHGVATMLFGSLEGINGPWNCKNSSLHTFMIGLITTPRLLLT